MNISGQKRLMCRICPSRVIGILSGRRKRKKMGKEPVIVVAAGSGSQ